MDLVPDHSLIKVSMNFEGSWTASIQISWRDWMTPAPASDLMM